MIRAVLYQAGGQLTGFSVRGHAGYAPEGSDIVCAAVSVLTTTCVNALESVAGVVPEVHGGEDGFLEAALHAGWQGFWFSRSGKLAAFLGA